MKNWLIGFCSFIILSYSACTYDQLSTLEECDNEISIVLVEQIASACGVPSGSITVAVDGVEAGMPIVYRLNGGESQDTPSFNELPAGNYEVNVQQGLCEASLEVIVENAEGLRLSSDVTPSACGATTGSINLNPMDASGQVMYSLDGGAEQPEAAFTGLAPGNYQITAVDEIGCQVILEATVPSDVGFENIEAIITSSCALSGCHAGNVSPDFRVSANIVAQADRIGSRTSSRSMPPSGSGITLSQDQIDAISCWIADGASE